MSWTQAVLDEMGMTYADVYRTTTYQQYALLDEDAAFHWAIGDLYAEYEAGEDQRIEESWERIVAEYHAIGDAYWQTPYWRALARQCYRRDGYACRIWSTHPGPLVAHHRNYAARRGEETLDDLTTLCKSCHEGFHKGPVRVWCFLPPAPPNWEPFVDDMVPEPEEFLHLVRD
jgi:5-methylcytosine-specific restriction endonuclease McrA